MTQILVLVFLVAVVAIGWRYLARRKKLQQAPVVRERTPKSYHAVEVRPGRRPCKAVQDLGNVRFLSDQAPSLPVPGCMAATCTCSFIHHDDRRQEDRRHPYGQWSSVPPALSGERRSRTERRKSQESTFKPVMTS